MDSSPKEEIIPLFCTISARPDIIFYALCKYSLVPTISPDLLMSNSVGRVRIHTLIWWQWHRVLSIGIFCGSVIGLDVTTKLKHILNYEEM